MRKIIVAFLFPVVCAANITSTVDKTGPFVITGLPQTIPVGFPFQQGANLVVLDTGAANSHDPAVTLVLGSDYTVSGGNYNSANQMQTGSISVVSTGVSSVQVNDNIVILRGVTINQAQSFTSTGPLTIALLEQALDKQATISQQINELGSRALKFENFEFTNPVINKTLRANNILAFDANGNVNYLNPTSISGSTVAIAGTNHQINAVNSGSVITLSTPQNIDLTSTPQFARIGLGSASNSNIINSPLFNVDANGNFNGVGLYLNGSLAGNSGSWRTDSQIEVHNPSSPPAAHSHTLVTLVQTVNPGSTVEEASVNFMAYDSAGSQSQMGALAYSWSNATAGALVSVANIHCNYNTSSTDYPFVAWGNAGAAMWPSDPQFGSPGSRNFLINGRIQAIAPGSGSSLTVDRTTGPGIITIKYNGTETGSIQAVSGSGINFYTGASPALGMTLISGLQVGSAPTGGDKGTGTINISADIYKNNTAYTNPDYVLEKWATGKIVKFADKEGAEKYSGPKSLAYVKSFALTNYCLPGFGQNSNKGLFAGSDQLLASVEEVYIHLFEHQAKLESLESRTWEIRLFELVATAALLLGIRANFLNRKP